MNGFCPKCGRIAEYHPYSNGTGCTCCNWYVVGRYDAKSSITSHSDKNLNKQIK